MQVKVKILEVLEWQLPELELEACQQLEPSTTSVEGFMASLREAVREQAKQELQVCTCFTDQAMCCQLRSVSGHKAALLLSVEPESACMPGCQGCAVWQRLL